MQQIVSQFESNWILFLSLKNELNLTENINKKNKSLIFEGKNKLTNLNMLEKEEVKNLIVWFATAVNEWLKMMRPPVDTGISSAPRGSVWGCDLCLVTQTQAESCSQMFLSVRVTDRKEWIINKNRCFPSSLAVSPHSHHVNLRWCNTPPAPKQPKAFLARDERPSGDGGGRGGAGGGVMSAAVAEPNIYRQIRVRANLG